MWSLFQNIPLWHYTYFLLQLGFLMKTQGMAMLQQLLIISVLVISSITIILSWFPFLQKYSLRNSLFWNEATQYFSNFLFPSESHEWLLSDAVDILPHLLLPLAGPEEFPEDDMEKLPPDLQYLGDDKQREADPDIRKMLLEALLQVGKSLRGGGYFRSVQCVAGTL